MSWDEFVLNFCHKVFEKSIPNKLKKIVWNSSEDTFLQ